MLNQVDKVSRKQVDISVNHLFLYIFNLCVLDSIP